MTPTFSAESPTPQKSKASEILKAEREKKRYTFQSIHQETKISIPFLEALEKSDWKAFPAEVYLVGFMRKYAQYLGLNPEELVSIYRQEMESQTKVVSEDLVQVEKKKKEKEARVILRMAALAAVILVFIITQLYIGLRQRKPAASKGVESIPGQTALPFSSASAEKAAAPNTEKITGLKLELFATQTVWVRVNADDNLVHEGFLAAGSKAAWQANAKFQLRIGNVYALRAVLNHLPLDLTQGAKSAVNEMTLTPETLKTLEQSQKPYDEKHPVFRGVSLSSSGSTPEPRSVASVAASTASHAEHSQGSAAAPLSLKKP